MDSFAGSEPREFIPFYLGTESNGQPAQTSTDGRTINGSTTLQQSNEAEQTNCLTNVTDTSTSPNQVAAPTIPLSLLHTAIEIIEDNTSHSSTSQDPVENTSTKSSISEDLASKRPHSPDYSPSLINLLASENSSSGESVQAFIARKVKDQTVEESEGSYSKEPRMRIKKVRVRRLQLLMIRPKSRNPKLLLLHCQRWFP